MDPDTFSRYSTAPRTPPRPLQSTLLEGAPSTWRDRNLTYVEEDRSSILQWMDEILHRFLKYFLDPHAPEF